MELVRFKNRYQEVRKDLQDKFNYKNPFQIPSIEKISINISDGRSAVANSKSIQNVVDELALIAGQKPIKTFAKKSNAAFKLREGMVIGAKVTLRGNRVYEFLERLILIALPRMRDFRGFSPKNFDGRGNMSFGVKEQIIFPEINYDKVDKIRGMDITIVTSAKTDKEALELLKGFYFPFPNN